MLLICLGNVETLQNTVVVSASVQDMNCEQLEEDMLI